MSHPEPSSQEESQSHSDAELQELRTELEKLGSQFRRIDTQLLAYLENKRAPIPSDADSRFQVIQDQLEKVLAACGSEPSSSTDSQSPATSKLLTAIKKSEENQAEIAQKNARKIVKGLSEHLAEVLQRQVTEPILQDLNLPRLQQVMHETLTTELDRREELAAEKLRLEDELPAFDDLEEAEIEEEPIAPESWVAAVWGEELARTTGFQEFQAELNRRFLEGDPAISGFVGHLLVYRQAGPEAKPQLLKDIGEAYYRANIDRDVADHPFERALIGFLEADCDRVGLSNKIETVHPGERFDQSRHSSGRRGVEIAQVYGWIVLSEGGRVYTRASVAAR